jgi:hypothetical protein
MNENISTAAVFLLAAQPPNGRHFQIYALLSILFLGLYFVRKQ